MRAQLEGGHLNRRRVVSPETVPDGTLILDFWPPELLENKCLLSKASSPWYLAVVALADYCNRSALRTRNISLNEEG